MSIWKVVALLLLQTFKMFEFSFLLHIAYVAVETIVTKSIVQKCSNRYPVLIRTFVLPL